MQQGDVAYNFRRLLGKGGAEFLGGTSDPALVDQTNLFDASHRCNTGTAFKRLDGLGDEGSKLVSDPVAPFKRCCNDCACSCQGEDNGSGGDLHDRRCKGSTER